MANKISERILHNSYFHVSKRTDMPKWQAWLIRLGSVVVALFISAIVSSILKPGTFGAFIQNLFLGTFGTPNRVLKLFQNVAVLLLISLAVTPAFKMKFWNIGAEGQVLIGGLMSVVCIKYLGGKIDNSLLIVIMLAASIVGGSLWAVIPALFKAKWNTNETLFTLMMNYIAMGLISICIAMWVTSGSQNLGVLKYGHFPKIGGYNYILNIIIVAVITVLVAVYLRYSKHGYELTVVGESRNTAKYIGIYVSKVIVRTMFLSGALAGIAGWILVGGTGHTLSTSTAGGMGFTAILVSWLANFNPLSMVFTAFLVQFFNIGSAFSASNFGFGTAFPDIITGVFFFVIIASEFFVNYRVLFNKSLLPKRKKKAPAIQTACGGCEEVECKTSDECESLCECETKDDSENANDNISCDCEKSDKEVAE